MKCKTCGSRTQTLAGMAAHYRKKHPSKMKRTVKKVKTPTRRARSLAASQYCSKCGQPI